MRKEHSSTKLWSRIKDEVFGEVGTPERDGLEKEAKSFVIGAMIRQARESKNMTQEELASIISKKRSYISRVENDGSNINLKTLFDIVEKGLGGRVNIDIRI